MYNRLAEFYSLNDTWTNIGIILNTRISFKHICTVVGIIENGLVRFWFLRSFAESTLIAKLIYVYLDIVLITVAGINTNISRGSNI